MNPRRFSPNRRLRIGCLAFSAIFLLVTASLHPNENTIEYDTSVAGQIVPVEESIIQVRSENLKIRFNVIPREDSFIADMTGMVTAAPVRVEVTARYDLFNPSTEDRSPLIAFPILRNGPQDRLEYVRMHYALYRNADLPLSTRRGVRCKVAVNEKEIPFEYVSFESLFEKERTRWAEGVRAWLSEWPEIASAAAPQVNRIEGTKAGKHGLRLDLRMLERYWDLVRKAGVADSTKTLLHVAGRQQLAHPRIDQWDLDVLSFLYATTHPGEDDGVAAFQARWGVESPYLNPLSGERFDVEPLSASGAIHYDLSRLRRRVDFLQYRPTLPAGKATTVEVRFSHLVDVDMYSVQPNGRWWPYTYQFQYILKTSPKWRSFGPIQMTLEIPSYTAYSISLPVQYLGEREKYDRYTYELAGAKAQENLLIGMMLIRPWDKRSVWDFVPGDSYEKPLGPRALWAKYEADPHGPFADDYLFHMGWRIMRGELAPADLPFFIERLQVSESNQMYSTPQAAVARAAMCKIPDRYPMRYCDGQMMNRLYAYAKRKVDVENVRNLQGGLHWVQRRERELHRKADRIGMTRRGLEAKIARLKDVTFLRHTESLEEYLRLCETYLAGYENRGATRVARFKAAIARVELETRLAKLPRLDFRLQYEICHEPEVFLRYWTVYTVYRDLPESADLLRLLAWARSGPGSFATRMYPRAEEALALDTARCVDDEVKTRGIETPDKHKPGVFPPWLGVN